MKLFRDFLSLKDGEVISANSFRVNSNEKALADKHFDNPNIGQVHHHQDGYVTSTAHWTTPQGKYTTIYKFHPHIRKSGKMLIYKGSHLVPPPKKKF